jgi:hypothetical protein
MKKKVAILLSGHLRNFEEIINNFKNNFIKEISEEFDYDIYIHTWNNNFTEDNVMNYDRYFLNIKVNNDYIYNLFQKNGLIVKKIIIENQKELYNLLNINSYLHTNTNNRSIHDKFNIDYVKDLTNKLFWQYYGHYKLINNLDNNDDYDFIIKSRPDIFYEKFDKKLFEYDIFFPETHQFGDVNINQIFFGGKTKYMTEILKFFENFIFYNKNINFPLINNYHKTDINFNRIFRHYIINILQYKLFFTKYNPKIYRNNGNFKIIK